MKKINLEDIYNHYEYLARVETDSSNIDYKGNMLKAMKEACRQALELAFENAVLIKYTDNFGDPDKYLDKHSIINTIEQIEETSHENIPLYISMNGVEMRYDKHSKQYWRDAGAWGVDYKYLDDVLVSSYVYDDMPWLNNVPLVEITYDEWKKGNEEYVITPLITSSIDDDLPF